MTVGEMRKLTTKSLQGFGDGLPRDYLNEALLILEGKTMILPIREHLQALADRLAELSENQGG